MKQRTGLLIVGLALTLLAGCQTTPPRSEEPDISLESAKELIVSGQVQSIFQPHHGCVVLTLKDGRILTFEQPHLDWVLSFVADSGLSNALPVAVE